MVLDTRHRRRVRIALLLAVTLARPGVEARAQDASTVLRLFVNYRTLKNTTTLTDERRAEVEALEVQAMAAASAGRYRDALRAYHHAMTLLRGHDWTPARAFGLALDLKSDRIVVDPGDTVRLSLTQSFALETPLATPLPGTVALARRGTPPTEIVKELTRLEAVPPDVLATPFLAGVLVPDVPEGDYLLLLTLQPHAADPIVETTPLRVARGLTARVARLKDRATRVRASLSNPHGLALLKSLEPVEYVASMLDLAGKGELDVMRLDLAAELASAEATLGSVEHGEPPLGTRRGDFRWAYRSELDGTLQPYRIFIPSSYDPAKPAPLVVALHGMGTTEDSYFTTYGNGQIKREAEARGYIVVCPKGRGPASMYRDSAERDVLDVIARVREDYTIDPDRIYLTGHSMGGYGTWSIAARHPALFAAVAPVAGGGDPASLAAIGHVPQLVVHGDKDPTVSIEESRKMVRAAKALGTEVRFIEVPGGNHVDIVVPTLKDVFDWFDAHRRQDPKARTGTTGRSGR